MKNRILAVILLLATAASLCGCGSAFDREYVSVEEYVPQVQDSADSDDKINVRSFSGLKQALIKFVAEGFSQGTIVFDSAYEGDAADDLDKACWQVKTRDALCVYCVKDIEYELRRIVTYDEADIKISFTSAFKTAGDIQSISYSTDADELIKEAVNSSRSKLVLLIANSAYSAVDMESLVQQVYRANPAISPAEPRSTVNMYSGTGKQRLYEIRFNYNMTTELLKERKAALSDINAFKGVMLEDMDELERAELAQNYLLNNCARATEGQGSTVYSALVEHSADSIGLALAYVELCSQLDVKCQIVSGQKNWSDHCWNIISINDEYYHVDVSSLISGEGQMLNSDEMMWELYRWDTSAYPICEGVLTAPETVPEAPQ